MTTVRIDTALNSLDASDRDLASIFRDGRNQRLRLVDQIHADLVRFGVNEGYAENVIRNALNALWGLNLAEWCAFVVFGVPAIVTTIQNDATLPWLDQNVGGKSVRTRLVERLSA